MMLALLQCIAFAAVVAFLCTSRIRQRRKNVQSWDSLLARLRLDWSARELSDLCSPREGRKSSPGEKWSHIRGAHGLWAMYRNAGVMADMASYAIRNGSTLDPAVLAGLRTDAVMIRISILRTIAKFALGAAQESVCIGALQIESIFMEMELRTAEFLESAAPAIVPQFAATM